MWRRIVPSLAAGLLLAGPCFAQHGEPLHVRNLNPLVAVFGLPAWDVVKPGTELGVTGEIASHYRLSQRGGQVLVLDGETLRTNVSLSHGFASGWQIGAELPFYRVGGGVLDDAIDAWHSAFDLPDGGRNLRPEGELAFVLGDRRGNFFSLTEPDSGLGDAQLKIARTIGANDGFVVQGSVKLPTGDEALLAGSGSTDVALTLLRSRTLPTRLRPAGYFWGVGVVRAGEPEQIEFDSERWVYTAILGGTWQPWPRFGLRAQLDVHGAFFDSPLEEIGEDAIEATFGAFMYAGRRGTLELAFVEDLEVSTSPDIVMHVAAKWQW